MLYAQKHFGKGKKRELFENIQIYFKYILLILITKVHLLRIILVNQNLVKRKHSFKKISSKTVATLQILKNFSKLKHLNKQIFYYVDIFF